MSSIIDEAGTLNIEAFAEQAHKELEIAKLANPSDELEAGWVTYLEKIVKLTDDWIAFANQPYNPDDALGPEDDRGPNERYQMFSRFGNDACEEMVAEVVAAGLAGSFDRRQLQARKEQGQNGVARRYPEVNDTEPDGQICHELNERLCKPMMWQEYGRWTG